MLAMASGGFVRSLHDKLFVDPVRRVVAQEVENASVRLVASFEEVHQDLRRILGDLADANDQVAEAIGRSLTRLSAETEALHDELHRLGRAPGEPEPPH
jgi:ABC-type transporter Mla subunit MlaD